MKRIANIVFYKFNGERPNMKQACIFYTDGTVKNVSYEDGLEACQEIVAAHNITTRQAFKEIINNKAVYVMSGREFESRFQSFISREDLNNSTELASFQPQNTDMVAYQKVKRPVNNDSVQNESENKETTGLNNVNVPADFMQEIEQEIDEQNNLSVAEETDDASPASDESAESFARQNPVRPAKVVRPSENSSENDTNPGTNTAVNKRPVIITPPVVNRQNVNPATNEEDNDALDNSFINGLNEEEQNRRPAARRPVVVPPVQPEENAAENVIPQNNNQNREKATPVAPTVIPAREFVGQPAVNPEDNFEDYEFVDDEELVYDADAENDYDADIEDNYETQAEKAAKPKKENKIVAWFKRGFEKIKNMKLVKKITAVVLALAMGLGLYSCAARQTKSGEMHNSNLSTSTTQELNNEKRGGHLFLIYGNNDHWNDYSFEELQKVTTNESQKEAMNAVAKTLDHFNDTFANAHVEEGKDVKPALTFDEVVALQQAYNTYTPEQIKAIFNGASVNAGEMGRAYRDATLQLMGAYVIETREHPVDMSGIINTEEGRAFYQKYQDLFLDAKEATGEDKLKKIELFYKAVREDFPITNEVRTEGIAHADDYATIEPYKLSVTPIIAAAEIMFQNYEVDYTLTDSEIDFLNDLGLCNFADDTFGRIECITLTSEEDNKNPLYSQYRDAIIYMMKQEGNYYVDDEHRELTKLDAFQEQVNWHLYEGRWVYSSYTYYTTEAHTETKTWTETETTTRVEETREEKPITEEAKEEVDKQIEEENEQARQEAEEEAEQTRQEMQEEADEEAERIEEEVRQDAEDLEEKIEDANEQIKENQDGDPTNDQPVNEEDLGHGVEFDDEHQDGNGNLNDSVENLTTDPHGDETGSDFPDPNETGREFDAAGEEMNGEPFAAAAESKVTKLGLTNEQLVDLYIEQLSNTNVTSEKGFQYRK